MKKIVLGGTHSNSGKTTVTASILKALSSRGMNLAPFKAGPDYIDPMFHKFVCGKPSHNLDTFMLNSETVNYLFQKNSRGTDLSIVEGVMGLYDGLGTEHTGSTAYLSEVIEAPVVLVMNAKGMSRSAAAMVSGYAGFRKETDVKGVILNNVSGDKHYSLLEGAINDHCEIKCLGYLPPNKEIEISSRHLGLVPVEELEGFERKIEIMGRMAEDNLDLDGFIDLSKELVPNKYTDPGEEIEGKGSGLRIGIAQDRAFNFYYNDNLQLFRQAGVELVEFSPIEDEKLPGGIDGLYLGGGFPEVFAEELSSNKTMLSDIREKLEAGMPAFAECGGLMYLTSAIENLDSSIHETVGFFDCRSVMTKRLQRFGYVNVNFGNIDIKGHEFHHTKLEGLDNSEIKFSYHVEKASDEREWECGLTRKNVLAGYAHIHFYSNIDFFKKLLKNYKGGKNDN